jgi:hypothetical protein
MRFASVVLGLALAACSPSNGPQTGSQTNWLRACDTSEECGLGLECVCGACTATCLTDPACADLPGATCVAASDKGTIALCSGQAPPINLCLPRCGDDTCAAGTSCIAGVCMPTESKPAEVSIDPERQYQTLVGFGAGLGYAEDRIASHPDRESLYDVFFKDAGLDVLRVRNRYDDGDDPFSSTVSIVQAAKERIGRAPVLFMSSPTPPASLKANDSRACKGDPLTCTLVTLPDGGFDYAGFANYWRSALEEYAEAGITPDYISIQSHPNWIAPAEVKLDACLFLPEEGKTTVTVDDTPTEVTYPGYREALEAVKRAIADLPTVPRIGAPETGLVGVGDFVKALSASDFDALAFHAYTVDPEDLGSLEAVRTLGEQRNRPILQTEMQAEGLDTAVLIHHTLTTANASAYLQNDLTSSNADSAGLALAYLTDEDFELQGTYYAFWHYAKRTGPGWVRVDAAGGPPGLLSSAWLAPDQSALTIVFVNPTDEDVETKVVLPQALGATLTRSVVTRTVFDGLERGTSLGALPETGVVRVPRGAVATVFFQTE